MRGCCLKMPSPTPHTATGITPTVAAGTTHSRRCGNPNALPVALPAPLAAHLIQLCMQHRNGWCREAARWGPNPATATSSWVHVVWVRWPQSHSLPHSPRLLGGLGGMQHTTCHTANTPATSLLLWQVNAAASCCCHCFLLHSSRAAVAAATAAIFVDIEPTGSSTQAAQAAAHEQ